MITYFHVIKALEYLLDHAGELHWRDWLRADIDLWRSESDVSHHLNAYGGMGSLNDLWISTWNGRAISEPQKAWINETLSLFRHLAFQTANCLKKRKSGVLSRIAVNKVLWTTRGNMQLDGWRCLNCGRLETQINGIERFLAKEVLPGEISRAKTESDLISIVEMSLLSPQSGVQKMREHVSAQIANSGIAVTERNGWMRPCPQCGSDNTEVCHWLRIRRRFALVVKPLGIRFPG